MIVLHFVCEQDRDDYYYDDNDEPHVFESMIFPYDHHILIKLAI